MQALGQEAYEGRQVRLPRRADVAVVEVNAGVAGLQRKLDEGVDVGVTQVRRGKDCVYGFDLCRCGGTYCGNDIELAAGRCSTGTGNGAIRSGDPAEEIYGIDCLQS